MYCVSWYREGHMYCHMKVIVFRGTEKVICIVFRGTEKVICIVFRGTEKVICIVFRGTWY